MREWPKLHPDEIPTSVALVERLIAAQRPEWARLPVRFVPESGTEATVYRLGDELAVRMPRTPGGVDGFETQVRWLRRIHSAVSCAIPEFVAQGEPTDEYPLPWTVWRWIPGETLRVTDSFDDCALATDLARFVTALRGVDPSGAPRSSRGGGLRDRDAPMRAALNALDPELDGAFDLVRIERRWEECLSVPEWSEAPVWVHGDLLPGNLLVDSAQRLVGVLDFALAGIGDPACDCIPAWSSFGPSGRARFREAIRVDDDTWARGQGWALSVAAIIIPYYRYTHPALVAVARRTVRAVLGEPSRGFGRRGHASRG